MVGEGLENEDFLDTEVCARCGREVRAFLSKFWTKPPWVGQLICPICARILTEEQTRDELVGYEEEKEQ